MNNYSMQTHLTNLTKDFRVILNELGRRPTGHLPELILGDGTRVSVQASKYHYCNPRKSISDTTQYTAFELGYGPVEIPELLEYAEDPNNLTGTVYPYVPYELVQSIINTRGGVDVVAMQQQLIKG